MSIITPEIPSMPQGLRSEDVERLLISIREDLRQLSLGEKGFRVNIAAKTAAYTISVTDDVILCGAGNQTFTVTLPAASGATGKVYHIKNVGTGTITVDGNGSETIDGGITAILTVQYESITILSEGSEWFIL
ncbi:hypothetical protein LCGC14_1110410 [marine sediment metagenome]|uniref:Uncharacterized protein n=1 Tax=marine sediment metagenome TaxID=412755 RepID=A0A0F9PPY7_9ZZZZ